MIRPKRRLRLFDVDDVFVYAKVLAERRIAADGAVFDARQRDDLYGFLAAEAWILSLKYDSSRCSSFSKYLHHLLWLRCVEWYRREYVDTRYIRYPPDSLERVIADRRAAAEQDGCDVDDWDDETVIGAGAIDTYWEDRTISRLDCDHTLMARPRPARMQHCGT